jgi:site-specific recombinase XerD
MTDPHDPAESVNPSTGPDPADLDEDDRGRGPARAGELAQASGQAVNAAPAAEDGETDPAAPLAGALVPAPIAPELVARATAEAHAACAALYLGNLAPSSRRVMQISLDLLAALLSGGTRDHAAIPWGELRYVHTQALRAVLQASCAPATANRHLAALRNVLRRAWRAGLMSADDYQAAIDLEPIRGEALPAGRSLSAGELRALFEACAADPAPARGLRDAAALALLYQGQLRRSEAIGVDVADYHADDGAVIVRFGKGRKERRAHLDGGGRRAVDAWLRARGPEPGPLLCPIGKGGRLKLRRLTDKAVRYIVAERAEQAGVADVSPHDFRRSSISDLLDQGVDLSTVQRMAGHADPKTTARYDRRGERTQREAAGRLHVPFVEPRSR